MSCGRASEIDVESFVVDATAQEFDSFRAHYPHCADCSAAVAGWSALELAMRDELADELGSEAEHPAQDLLGLFASARESMGEQAEQVERHLSTCPSCRTELALMSRFDPTSLLAESEPHSVSSAERVDVDQESLVAGLRRLLEALAETLFAPGIGRVAIPALALVAVVAASVWWSGLSGSRSGEPGAEPERIAEEPAPQSSPGSTLPPESPLLQDDPEGGQPLLAEEPREPQPALAENPVPSVPVAPEDGLRDDLDAPEPEQLAEVTPRPSEPEVAPAPTPSRDPDETLPAVPREEILLASLGDLGTPSYAAPIGGGSVAWMDRYGGVRTGTRAAAVATRAPGDHVGLTLQVSPTLWWSIDEATALPIQITITGEDAIEPLLRVELAGPHAAGLHSIDLAERGVELQPGTDHRWFVSLLVDPDRTSGNPVATGAVRVVDPSDPRHEIVSRSVAGRRGHVLAAEGIWYDAYDFFASLAEASPDAVTAVEYRDRLAESAAR